MFPTSRQFHSFWCGCQIAHASGSWELTGATSGFLRLRLAGERADGRGSCVGVHDASMPGLLAAIEPCLPGTAYSARKPYFGRESASLLICNFSSSHCLWSSPCVLVKCWF